MLKVLMLAIGLMAASAAYADDGFDFGVDTGGYSYADGYVQPLCTTGEDSDFLDWTYEEPAGDSYAWGNYE